MKPTWRWPRMGTPATGSPARFEWLDHWNRGFLAWGVPKSSILNNVSFLLIINHPAIGVPPRWNTTKIGWIWVSFKPWWRLGIPSWGIRMFLCYPPSSIVVCVCVFLKMRWYSHVLAFLFLWTWWCWLHNHCLVGRLEHFIFFHILGIIIPLTNIFQRGWTHQPVFPTIESTAPTWLSLNFWRVNMSRARHLSSPSICERWLLSGRGLSLQTWWERGDFHRQPSGSATKIWMMWETKRNPELPIKFRS